MPLSEQVYCVSLTFKMTEQVEQWICIKFCINLEHSSMETIRVNQKATAIGNWWLAASSRQHTHSCIMSCAECFGEMSNHSGDSVPLQPMFRALPLLAFPKTKIIFEREEISDHQWDLGKYGRAADGDWNCVRSLLWRGPRYHCPVYNVSCIFFSKCLYFSYYVARYFLCVCVCVCV